MEALAQRLAKVARILDASQEGLKTLPDDELPGFVALPSDMLVQAILRLREIAPPPKTVLDLGCGHGGFLLLAAAAGYDAYGIEINPILVEHAWENLGTCREQGLIAQDINVSIAEGDMIPRRWQAAYTEFRRIHTENAQSMPQKDESGTGADVYAALGVTMRTADVIYCWAWPTQSRFLYNILAKETADATVFVLPSYLIYAHGEHMAAFFKERNELTLQEIAPNVKDVFFGKKAT